MTSMTNNGSTLEIAQSNQDLIITKRTRKKRLWLIAAAILVIAIVVIIAIFTFVGSDKTSLSARISSSGPTISLEDVLGGKFGSKSFNASWVSGHELLYRSIDDGSIMIYNVQTNNRTEILPGKAPVLKSAFEYELSPDHKFLLIAHDYQKIYRHSYVAQYSVVNLSTKQVTKVLANQEHVLHYAKWAPVGNGLVYVARYNIFYKSEADSSMFKTLTVDGLAGHIYNGVPDWVYEEEVLSSKSAAWFSPDGKRLVYAKFNDTRVPLMTIPLYGTPGTLEFQYTRAIQIRYPKPGTKNPDVSLHSVNLEDEKQEVLEPPKTLGAEPILATVTWADNITVCAIWNNRIQNEADIITYQVDGEDQHVTKVRNIKEKSGWLELFTPPIFDKTGMEMVLILSQPQKDGGAYRHVTLLNRTPNNVSMLPLTSGKFVVTEILSWDHDKNLVYYQANTEEDPAVKHVYSVHVPSKKVTCVTCKMMTTVRKTNCLMNDAMFSADNSHYVLQCVGPDVPEIAIIDAENNKKLIIWEENRDLIDLVQERHVPITKRMTFKVDEGFTAQVMLKLPPNIDMSGKTKYPMLINVYGGPNSFQVVEKFNLDWGSYLAANKSIIYAFIDARGSGLKGDAMLFSIYNKLGTKEVIDQINVTRQIQAALPYVDSNRTGIWGWSYGGYASGMALAQDKGGVFKCGISVAPVTDWILYDSIYTERFMGLPQVNPEAYYKAQLMNKYEGLRDKMYYLIHGTLDDNVHYQQSMLWSRVLEEQDILFRQQSYSDEDHSLASVRPHLYHSLERFLDECFSL